MGTPWTRMFFQMVFATVTATAWAQEVMVPDVIEPPEQPQTKSDRLPDRVELDRDIELANLVTSAQKGVTTVQEAPSIVTIITADEIRSRGFRTILEALTTVPGWMESSAIGNQVPVPLVRGVQQAALLLHDGISMFDPWANISPFGRSQPLENVKRLEIVTGPGGVLWGANSFLGIVNVIMKDADDVRGVEFNSGYGDGPGNRQNFRGYAMFGHSFFRGKLKIFQHVSYENYIGTTFPAPQFLANSPSPQPAGPAIYGGVHEVDPARSWLVTVDGKYSLGPVSVFYMVPVGDLHPAFSFGNTTVPNTKWNMYDRYAALEYRDRFLHDRIDLTARGYFTQFVRGNAVELFGPSSVFPAFTNTDGSANVGGFHFDFSKQLIQRSGGTVDADFHLPRSFRLLVGGELYYESLTGSTVYFSAPQSPADLPIYCPVQNGTLVPTCPRQFVNDASRFVGALYTNLQWRPVAQLALDGGVRMQNGFKIGSTRAYGLVPLYSAAVVWNFVRDFHFKAAYATGFRPPVYQNTEAALGGVEFGANPNLKNETSQSFEGELNARLLRNVRRVRELQLRLDYSYTYLGNLITIRQGQYENSGKRAIHSVEALSKLYLHGDHFVQAAYTYLYAVGSDVGVIRALPSHWFNVGLSFNLIKDTLDVNSNLTVTSAYQDPNRYSGGAGSIPGATRDARTPDITWDRLTPVALLQIGARARFYHQRITLSAQAYNVLNQRYYFPDPFYDLAPTVEVNPLPAPGFNVFASLGYRLPY